MIRHICILLTALLLFAGTTSTLNAQTTPTTTKVSTRVDAVTLKEARAAFNAMAVQKDIAFRYPDDGCYARAHLMAQRLLGMGIQPGKVWAFAQGKSFKKFKNLPVNLVVRTPHHPAGMVRWSYHVAPTIRVRRADGSVQMMVIDPSLFHEPVTIKKWLAVQTNGSKKPFVSKTRLGQPPLLPNGKRARGHGYWPANDPGDPDAHARAKMKEFKKKAAARHLAAIWSAPLSSAA